MMHLIGPGTESLFTRAESEVQQSRSLARTELPQTIQQRRRPSTNVMQTRELLYAGLTGNRGKMAKLDLHRLLGARLPE